MKICSLQLFSALVLACGLLSSCDGLGGGEHADVVNPTVAQMDDLDVRWGLPRRESKSAKRNSSAASNKETKTESADASKSDEKKTETQSSSSTPLSDDVKNRLRP